VLAGSVRGLETVVFGYVTTGGDGSGKATIVCFHLKTATLPEFHLSPQNTPTFEKLPNSLGPAISNLKTIPSFQRVIYCKQ
jgi:hypothetical protein